MVAPINVCLFLLALGRQPMYINMAVVNDDSSSPIPGFNLGKMVLAEIDNVTIIQVKHLLIFLEKKRKKEKKGTTGK